MFLGIYKIRDRYSIWIEIKAKKVDIEKSSGN